MFSYHSLFYLLYFCLFVAVLLQPQFCLSMTLQVGWVGVLQTVLQVALQRPGLPAPPAAHLPWTGLAWRAAVCRLTMRTSEWLWSNW